MSFMKTESCIEISNVIEEDKANFGNDCFTADHFAYVIWLDSKLMP